MERNDEREAPDSVIQFVAKSLVLGIIGLVGLAAVWLIVTTNQNEKRVGALETQTQEFQRGAHENHAATWGAINDLRRQHNARDRGGGG